MRLLNTRVLVTGAGGMLGDAICHVFAPRCHVSATDLPGRADVILDVRDDNAVDALMTTLRPDLVIHLAALVDLEYCEEHPAEAYRTNSLGTRNVALSCARHGASLVLVSTAGVFDGQQDAYSEADIPGPLSVYGKSKHEAELIVADLAPQGVIVRAGWMMGGGPAKDKKFVRKLLGQIRSGVRELKVVVDKLGSPTYTNDFAANLMILIESGGCGLYHMAGEGGGSRHDVALELIDALGISDQVVIEGVESTFWQQEYSAPRPASEQLINVRLRAAGLHRMRSWRQCVRDYMTQYPWHDWCRIGSGMLQVIP